MVEIEIPSFIKLKELSPSDLPDGWDAIPAQPGSQQIGDDFINKKQFAILKVPSVVVKGDFNFIINPNHQDFEAIRIIGSTPFPFDPRLFR